MGMGKTVENGHAQIRYTKPVLRLDNITPTYIMTEKTKRDEIWVEAGRIAVKYEEKNRVSEEKVERVR